jgi:hypothetical protein
MQQSHPEKFVFIQTWKTGPGKKQGKQYNARGVFSDTLTNFFWHAFAEPALPEQGFQGIELQVNTHDWVQARISDLVCGRGISGFHWFPPFSFK